MLLSSPMAQIADLQLTEDHAARDTLNLPESRRGGSHRINHTRA